VLKDDNENMVVCSLAKKYGVPKVVSRVEDDEHYDAFQIIGAETIGHTDLLISEFVLTVEHPYLVKLANLPNDREVLKASIESDSKLIGKTVKEMKEMKNFPNRFKPVSLLQSENTLAGELNVEMEEGNQLVLIGPTEHKEKLESRIKRDTNPAEPFRIALDNAKQELPNNIEDTRDDFTEWRELATFERRTCHADHMDGRLTRANGYVYLASDPAQGLFLNPYNTAMSHGTIQQVPLDALGRRTPLADG
jgi:hypothetical protein